MFKKAYLAKLEFVLPDIDELTFSLLLYDNKGSIGVCKDDDGKFFYAAYTEILPEPRYNRPSEVQFRFADGSAIFNRTVGKDCVLFDAHFDLDFDDASESIDLYYKLLRAVNEATASQIDGTKLTATITADTPAQMNEYQKLVDGLPIQILKTYRNNSDERKIEITQFDVVFKGNDLFDLKDKIENNLCKRLGIQDGIDKTHLIHQDILNSEQAIDLFNSFEMKMGKMFCDEFNRIFKPDTPAKVSIHEITKEDTIMSWRGFLTATQSNGGAGNEQNI